MPCLIIVCRYSRVYVYAMTPCLSIYLPVYRIVYITAFLRVCLSVCLSVYPSMYLFNLLCLHMSMHARTHALTYTYMKGIHKKRDKDQTNCNSLTKSCKQEGKKKKK